MAKSGMNPKTPQYLMGHSDISVTLNVYTHVTYEDACSEVKRIESENPRVMENKNNPKFNPFDDKEMEKYEAI